MTYQLGRTLIMCSFQCLYHRPVFQRKAASLPKVAIGKSSVVSYREFKFAWRV